MMMSPLKLMHNEVEHIIEMRSSDRYVDGTHLIQLAGCKKSINSWKKSDAARNIISSVSKKTNIAEKDLFKVSNMTWIHPELAIQLVCREAPDAMEAVLKWIRDATSDEKSASVITFENAALAYQVRDKYEQRALELIQNGYLNLSIRTLAQALNFTPKESGLMKILWNPLFKGSWIRLDDNFIAEYLLDKPTANNINHFITRNIDENKDFIENKDYSYGALEADLSSQTFRSILNENQAFSESKSELTDESRNEGSFAFPPKLAEIPMSSEFKSELTNESRNEESFAFSAKMRQIPVSSESKSELANEPKKGRPTKRPYVTDECLQQLLMMSKSTIGNTTRCAFIKIKNAVPVMIAHQTIVNSLQMQIQASKTDAKSRQLRIEDAKKMTAIAAELQETKEKAAQNIADAIHNKELAEEALRQERIRAELEKRKIYFEHRFKVVAKRKKGFIYIVTSRHSHSNFLYKIGKTVDLEARLSMYKSSNADDSKKEYQWHAEVPDIDFAEHLCKHLVQQWRVDEAGEPLDDPKSLIEMVKMPLLVLKEIMLKAMELCFKIDEIASSFVTDEIVARAIEQETDAKLAQSVLYQPIYTIAQKVALAEAAAVAGLPNFCDQEIRDLPASKALVMQTAINIINAKPKTLPKLTSVTSTPPRSPQAKITFRMLHSHMDRKLAILPAREIFDAYAATVLQSNLDLRIAKH